MFCILLMYLFPSDYTYLHLLLHVILSVYGMYGTIGMISLALRDREVIVTMSHVSIEPSQVGGVKAHTYMHKHTHVLSLTNTHARTRKHTLYLSDTHIHAHPHTHTLSDTHIYTLTQTGTLSLSLMHTTHTHARTHTHGHTNFSL